MNRNTEQKSIQRRRRFNIADVVIIFVIVAILAALGLRMYNIFGTEKEICNVEVTFRVNGISEISAENSYFKNKDKLYCSETDEEIGYIKDFAVSDMTEYAYNENGELVEAKVPGKKNITGTIVLTCEKTDKGLYLVGTDFITIGEKVSLYTAASEMTFEITAVKEIASKMISSAK